jgi:hypothetical protein
VSKGEQGVLLLRPYKDEILPYWKFKRPQLAHASAQKILKLFNLYKKKEDFIRFNDASKLIQISFTSTTVFIKISSLVSDYYLKLESLGSRLANDLLAVIRILTVSLKISLRLSMWI